MHLAMALAALALGADIYLVANRLCSFLRQVLRPKGRMASDSAVPAHGKRESVKIPHSP